MYWITVKFTINCYNFSLVRVHDTQKIITCPILSYLNMYSVTRLSVMQFLYGNYCIMLCWTIWASVA